MKVLASFLSDNMDVATPAVVAAVLLLAAAGGGIVFFLRRLPRRPRRWLEVLMPLVIIGGAVAASWHLYRTRPSPPQVERKPSATLVEVQTVQQETRRVRVRGMGLVIPARVVTLKPQVTGTVFEQSPQLVPGGRFKAGDVLVRVDPSDYELAVRQAEADVNQARSDLALEKGRQVVAEREWKLLGTQMPESEAGRALALRKPQLAAAEAKVDTAESRLDQARLNLERTVIRAPFNGVVTEENSELSQLVSPTTAIATLIGTDEFWVRVSIPLARLRFIDLPGSSGAEGAPVEIIQATGRDDELRRRGRVVRLLGDLDPKSRFARVLVAVEDPFGIESHARPLLAESYVSVEIEGRELGDVVAVPRTALREGGCAWVMNADNRLDVRPVKVAWNAEDMVLVHSLGEDGTGLRDGERIVTSTIPAPVPGILLRVEGEDGE